MDAQVGKVVDWLKRENAYDNTMIVIASDLTSHSANAIASDTPAPLQNLLRSCSSSSRTPPNGVGPARQLDRCGAQRPRRRPGRIPATMQGRNLAGTAEPRTCTAKPSRVRHAAARLPRDASRKPSSLADEVHHLQQRRQRPPRASSEFRLASR